MNNFRQVACSLHIASESVSLDKRRHIAIYSTPSKRAEHYTRALRNARNNAQSIGSK